MIYLQKTSPKLEVPVHYWNRNDGITMPGPWTSDAAVRVLTNKSH